MTTYFVTGTNRGIGAQTVVELLSNPENIVIASVRNTANLGELSTIKSSNLHIITLDTSDSFDKIKSDISVIDKISPNGVDVVIQNAGIATFDDPSITVDVEAIQKDIQVNYLGSAKVYQAVEPYWLKKDNGVTKKFFFISTLLASLSFPLPLRPIAYGASKAAINFLVTGIAFQTKQSKNELFSNAIVASIHPGLVETDMGSKISGIPELKDQKLFTPAESAKTIVKVFNNATKDVHGKFLSPEGTPLPF